MNVIQVWYCVKIVPENSLKVLKSGWIKELLLLKVKKLKVVRWDFIEMIGRPFGRPFGREIMRK